MHFSVKVVADCHVYYFVTHADGRYGEVSAFVYFPIDGADEFVKISEEFAFDCVAERECNPFVLGE